MKLILISLLISSFCMAEEESPETNHVTNVYNYYNSDGSSYDLLYTMFLMSMKKEYHNNPNVIGGCTYKTIDVTLKNGTKAPFYYCN